MLSFASPHKFLSTVFQVVAHTLDRSQEKKLNTSIKTRLYVVAYLACECHRTGPQPFLEVELCTKVWSQSYIRFDLWIIYKVYYILIILCYLTLLNVVSACLDYYYIKLIWNALYPCLYMSQHTQYIYAFIPFQFNRKATQPLTWKVSPSVLVFLFRCRTLLDPTLCRTTFHPLAFGMLLIFVNIHRDIRLLCTTRNGPK